jgi:hypothetical protein
MNDRSRIRALFSGRVPDRVPWFGDLAYWAHAMEVQGQVPENWQRSEDYYRFHRELGVGFYLQGYWAFRQVTDPQIAIETRAEGDRRFRDVHTPLGTLHEEQRYLPEAFAQAPVRHMINSPDDLRILRYWLEHTEYVPAPEEALRRHPWVAEQGIVLCYLPRSPFMELTAVLAGISNVVNLWVEARDELEDTLRLMAERFDLAAEASLRVPADCFMIPENLSSEVVGHFYATYARPWEQKWTARLREMGKHSFIHMDGTLALLGQVADAGFDVIEAFTPKPVGDASIHEVRAMAGPNPILWGGLPGVYFTSLVSDQEFDRHVREVLAVMVEDKRMVLGVADQVPPDALRRRVARVVELVERYGRYV